MDIDNNSKSPGAPEPALLIPPADSLTDGDSREPELNATPDGTGTYAYNVNNAIAGQRGRCLQHASLTT